MANSLEDRICRLECHVQRLLMLAGNRRELPFESLLESRSSQYV